MLPAYPELVKVVREEEALLYEKNQGSRELSRSSFKVKEMSAQLTQVEKSTLEEDSDGGRGILQSPHCTVCF